MLKKLALAMATVVVSLALTEAPEAGGLFLTEFGTEDVALAGAGWAPRAEDFPGAPPENLVAGSVVFSPPDHPVKLNNHFQWWSYVKGANWRHPEGPNSTIKDRGKYPVAHIAYQDVLAYAKWSGKRVPTEAEFEFAQRGGLERKPASHGQHLSRSLPENRKMLRARGPLPPNALYDMAGDVWN